MATLTRKKWITLNQTQEISLPTNLQGPVCRSVCSARAGRGFPCNTTGAGLFARRVAGVFATGLVTAPRAAGFLAGLQRK
jgi:hypothetical protein